MRLLLLDTNLLLLVLVGRTDLGYIRMHRRTREFEVKDFAFLQGFVSAYDGTATTAHVLAETSNLLRQVRQPAQARIQATFHDFVRVSRDVSVASLDGCAHADFAALGLTDAAILVACERSRESRDPLDLVTADEPLYERALALGLPADFYPA